MKEYTDIENIFLNHQISDSPEVRYAVLPKQKEFLIQLQSTRSQTEYSTLEQVCIAHCLRYDEYSEIHKDTLNNLIKKYGSKR